MCLVTVFSEPNCEGESKLIRSDINYRPNIWDPLVEDPSYEDRVKGSWTTYGSGFWSKFNSGMTESAWMTGGCTIELFNEGAFKSESQTVRYDPTRNYECWSALYIPKLNGWAWASASGATSATEAQNNGYFGYFAWQVRETYFPPSWASYSR